MAATIFKDCKIGKVIIPDFSHASFSSESKTITLALKVTAAQKEELEAILRQRAYTNVRLS